VASETTGSYEEKDAEEEETVGIIKEIRKVFDSHEFITRQEADDTGKDKQAAEYSGCPAKIIDEFAKFHKDRFW
jgi:hypothetical protein